MIKESVLAQIKQPTEISKSLGLRLRESDLAILNQRFKIDGFQNLSHMVKSYLNGEIAKSNKTDQLSRLLIRLKEKNIVDPLTGEVTPTFYKNIDIDDFRHYLNSKYKFSKYGNNLAKYYQRFAEFFFTKPEIVRAESGRNRAWICDAMRRFGEYYDYKHQNPEMKMLVKEIIERYEINRHMRVHDKVWITDLNYLDTSITKILITFNKGELSILIRFALFTGLRGEEISYVHQKPVCPKLAGCNCENLHVVNKSNGMSVVVINRNLGQKHCYFTIVPSKLWQEFRALSKADYEFRKFAHLQIKEATKGEVTLMDLRKFNYNVNVRSEMKEMGAEVLAGRAKTVSARHYLLNELDLLAEQFGEAWKKYLALLQQKDIDIPFS
jgi:hypothetical protein